MSYLKKIMIIIVGFILMLLISQTKTNAIWLNSFYTIRTNTDFYCLNVNSSNHNYVTEYTDAGTFTIRGNLIKRGTEAPDYPNASEEEKQELDRYRSKENSRLASILLSYRGTVNYAPIIGDSGHYITQVASCEGQQAFWKRFSWWYNSVGRALGLSLNVGGADIHSGQSIYPTGTEYVNIADQYADDIEINNNIKITANDPKLKTYVKNGETLLMFGPFNTSYVHGWFDTVILIGDNGAEITPVGYLKYRGSTLEDVTQPPSGQNFYILFKDTKNAKYIKEIKFRTKAEVKQVTFTFYTSRGQQDLIEKKNYGWEIETYEASLEFNPPVPLTGELEFLKVDEETRKPLANVGFTVQNVTGGVSGQYVSIDSNGNAVYGNTPTTLFTDVNGKINIKNLFLGSYKIVEVINPIYGYYLDEELPTELATAVVNTGDKTVFTGTNRWRLGSLKVKKIDSVTKEPLAGVGFTIKFTKGINNKQYEGKYLTGKDGEEAYSDTPVTIYTDENGTIEINDIWEGTYEVTEVENPHYGYYIDGELPKVLGTFDITPYDEIGVTETNLRRWIRLSGFVWEDMISGKTSERDWLYSQGDSDETNPDKLVANVTVKLKDRNGNDVSFKTKNGQTVTQILTDSNGEYEMWDIEIDKLPDYYIEFSYNGMSYTSVPIVDLSPKNENSSKAKENNEERTTFNNNYSTITHNGTTQPVGEALNANGNKTYDLNYDENQHYVDETGATIDQVKSTLNYGSNPLYGYEGQNYPVNRVEEQYMIKATTRDAYQDEGKSGYLTDFASINEIRKSGKEEIEYINLGLVEREQPDLAVVEDVENAKITLNGYEHTYKYSQRFNTNQESDGFNVGVKFGNEYGSASYTRTIYSSDIVYNMQAGNEGKLGVYITYKIALRNEATNLYTRVNEVINYYDERYEIQSITDETGNTLHYTEQGSAGNGFNKVVIETNQNIEHQRQKMIYITYKLQNEAVNAVLNQDVTLDSVTEISSYSTYSDGNYSTHYAGVDIDSRPGSAIPENANNNSDDENVNTYEDDTDSAPSLILEVSPEDGRIIRGTVWEDNAIEELLENSGYDKERKGDGLYANNENVVEKVKVELLTCTDDGNPGEVATLYHKNEALEEAEVYTGNDGSYEFSGIIPGKYLIRYTYGNESIIVSPDGSSTPIETVEKYKSTIYRAGDKTAAEAMTDYWYRTETGEGNTRMSDAKDEIGINSDGTRYDIVAERTEESGENVYTYGTITSENGIENPSNLENIEADTRIFDIKLDYDINLDNISEYGADLKFIFDNIDFGIVRRPIQNLDVRKEISYVQVKLANGQILIEGDPREGATNYLRFLPDGNVHLEIDQELIQGATITIRYEIVVDNREAEIDYNNEDYYIYGIVPTNHENWKIARISKLYDYLSNELIYDANNANNVNWTQIEIGQSLVTEGRLSQEAFETVKQFNQVLQTDAFKDMEPGQEIRVPLEVSRILSNSSGDLTFTNDVEVNEVTGRKMEHDGDYTIPGNYEPSKGETGYDDDYVYLTITGPTGENRNYIQYIILGTIGLITLGAGIILIKKKVL